MTDFQTEWDDLTFRLVEAFIDDDTHEVNVLVDEASRHPDLAAVLINLGGLAADLAIVFSDGTGVLCAAADLEREEPDAAKRHVEGLLRLRGAE
jgi:hypothetical protein